MEVFSSTNDGNMLYYYIRTRVIERVSSTSDGNILYIPNIRTNAIKGVSSTIDGNILYLYIPDIMTNAIGSTLCFIFVVVDFLKLGI